MAGNYRNIGGKRYALYDVCDSKASAVKQARHLKKTCASVRVIKVGAVTVGKAAGYAIYTRSC